MRWNDVNAVAVLLMPADYWRSNCLS